MFVRLPYVYICVCFPMDECFVPTNVLGCLSDLCAHCNVVINTTVLLMLCYV